MFWSEDIWWLLGSIVVAALVFLFIFLFLPWYLVSVRGGRSPFATVRLRPAADLHFLAADRLQKAWEFWSQRYPLGPSLDRAAVCPQTGKVIPGAINAMDIIQVPKHWQAACHCRFQPWSSLDVVQQKRILEVLNPGVSVFDGHIEVSWEDRLVRAWFPVPETSLKILVVQPFIL